MSYVVMEQTGPESELPWRVAKIIQKNNGDPVPRYKLLPKAFATETEAEAFILGLNYCAPPNSLDEAKQRAKSLAPIPVPSPPEPASLPLSKRSYRRNMVTTVEAAAIVGVRPNTLEFWRTQGKGPKFIKMGDAKQAHVRYLRSDVDEWMSTRTFTSTESQRTLNKRSKKNRRKA